MFYHRLKDESPRRKVASGCVFFAVAAEKLFVFTVSDRSFVNVWRPLAQKKLVLVTSASHLGPAHEKKARKRWNICLINSTFVLSFKKLSKIS